MPATKTDALKKNRKPHKPSKKIAPKKEAKAKSIWLMVSWERVSTAT